MTTPIYFDHAENVAPLPFGLLDEAERIVELCRFATDSEGYDWYERSGETRSLLDQVQLDTTSLVDSGSCYDTGEFFSPLASNMRSLLSRAPEGTTVVGFTKDGWVGTRTWEETITAHYYTGA